MKDFITTQDWPREALEEILALALKLKAAPFQPLLRDRTGCFVFFNPSMRTRTSFQLGMEELGGRAVMLAPGKDAWPIEFEDGAVMDGEPEEHVKEVAQVLSRYADLIGVRAFPKFQDWQVDREDRVILSFARYADVPVINMETITHPCQELAMALALKERWGQTDGKKFVLTWTYHPKPLNTAVANSALLIASKMGMDVTLLIPDECYRLDQRYLDAAASETDRQGHVFNITTDIDQAYEGADMVYAKSWGALPFFGKWEEEKPIREKSRHFMVDEKKMALTNQAFFSHCLPVRRNMKVTDAVLDSPNAIHIDEAENRLHVQKALMITLLKNHKG